MKKNQEKKRQGRNPGKVFEADFQESIGEKYFFQRIKDDTLKFRGVQNLCDYIVFDHEGGRLFLFELKSFRGKSCPFTNIKQYQIEKLNESQQKWGSDGISVGVIAGFILDFRDLSETYFIPAEKTFIYWKVSERRSFPISWVRENGWKINQEKKRVRYRYDVISFIEEFNFK